MRRKDREIMERTEIMDVLRRCDVCNVAFADGNMPYVIPMNFGIVEEAERTVLCFHCAGEGKKLEMLSKNARVAFAASCNHVLEREDSDHCTMRYESVCGSGTMRMADDPEKLSALDAIMSHYRLGKAEKKPFAYSESLLARTTVLLLEIEQMSGKRSAPAKQGSDKDA